MTRSPIVTRLAVTCALAAAACGGAKSEAASTTAQNEAQRAAAIEQAVRAAPTKADSILAANGLDADQLEALMYRVAADSAMSAEYRRLTAR
jgi:hypothetical protein